MPSAKEICRRVILGTRAIGSFAFAWSMRRELAKGRTDLCDQEEQKHWMRFYRAVLCRLAHGNSTSRRLPNTGVFDNWANKQRMYRTASQVKNCHTAPTAGSFGTHSYQDTLATCSPRHCDTVSMARTPGHSTYRITLIVHTHKRTWARVSCRWKTSVDFTGTGVLKSP